MASFAKCLAAAMTLLIPEASCAEAPNMDWLDAYESGSYQVLIPHLNAHVRNFERVNSAWGTTQSHRSSGANHDHFETVERQLCSLVIGVLNSQRALDQRVDPNLSLAVADRVEPLRQSLRELYDVARSHPATRTCDQLSWDEQLDFYSAVLAARAAESELSDITDRRRSGEIVWSNSLTLELRPLPLKLELLEGSLRLSLSTSIGPLRINPQTGVARSQTEYTGLALFRFEGPDGVVRYFDVRGLDFGFDTHQGRIDVDGSTLTYRCDEACADVLNSYVE